MAYLGDISICFPITKPSFFLGQFTRTKQPTSVIITATGATPGNAANLFTSAGTQVGRVNVDSAGEIHFYDLDDGGYNIYEVGTGNAWSVTVSGATVTIVRIASSGSPFAVYAA